MINYRKMRKELSLEGGEEGNSDDDQKSQTEVYKHKVFFDEKFTSSREFWIKVTRKCKVQKLMLRVEILKTGD